jgi:hypothetical protein
MNWASFTERAPELARLGAERFESAQLCLVGTLRRDGSPRISPVEPMIVDGELLLGMMWQSQKALDLQRDPRLAVHSVVSDRAGSEGDVKVYGRAVDVTDPGLRERYADAMEAKIDWRPPEPFHLFAVDVESAGFMVFGDDGYGLAWEPERGLRRLTLPSP